MTGLPMQETIAGFQIYRAMLDAQAQTAMAEDVRDVIRAAPLVQPVTAWGKPMSVRMTSAGRVGWVIERGRYRYSAVHPIERTDWPAIPKTVLDVWQQVSGWAEDPDSCLINWYAPHARMGLHQDKDEGCFDAPVVSISLGAPARFRMGTDQRKGPTRSTELHSGDVVVMAGPARLSFHGIDRILSEGIMHPFTRPGRLNLTLRVVKDNA